MTGQERTIKELLVHKSWQYLHDNFHKFNQTNQIKIALELCKKDMPTQLEGKVEGGAEQKIVVIYPAKEKVEDRTETIPS